jgi:hypothetical protein
MRLALALGFWNPVVGGVGRDADDLCALQGEGAGGFREPDVVADEESDPPQRRVEDRQLPAQPVQVLLLIPEVRLAVASGYAAA